MLLNASGKLVAGSPLHFLEDGLEVFGEDLPDASGDVVGDLLVEGLGDAAGDAGEGVAVAAQGNGQADRRLEVGAVEESHHGLGCRALAGGVPLIDGTDLVAGAVEVASCPDDCHLKQS